MADDIVNIESGGWIRLAQESVEHKQIKAYAAGCG